MNPLNNISRNAFSTTLRMESETHAAVSLATPIVQNVRLTTAAEPDHSLRGKAAGYVADLVAQLAEIDVEIKRLMQEIDAKRAQEQNAKTTAGDSQDQEQRITENLGKAADAYHDILDATSILA